MQIEMFMKEMPQASLLLPTSLPTEHAWVIITTFRQSLLHTQISFKSIVFETFLFSRTCLFGFFVRDSIQ